jgi:hypothetical protein
MCGECNFVPLEDVPMAKTSCNNDFFSCHCISLKLKGEDIMF